MIGNKKEFVELVKKYESLTFQETKEAWEHYGYYVHGIPPGHLTAQKLTGFGSSNTCTLCKAIDGECGLCVYEYTYACLSGEHAKSYNDIDYADTPEKLLDAFQKRAKHMRESYPELFKTT